MLFAVVMSSDEMDRKRAIICVFTRNVRDVFDCTKELSIKLFNSDSSHTFRSIYQGQSIETF